MSNPELIYSQAYAKQNTDKDFAGAMKLYRQLLTEHAESNWADYARKQVLKIEQSFTYVPDEEELRKQEAARVRLAELDGLERSQSLTFKVILSAYIGTQIGINAIDVGKTEAAMLAGVQADHFTVEARGLRVAIPFSQVLKITTASDGAVLTSGFFSDDYRVVVRVFDFVIYKGSIGVSMPI